MNWLDLVILGIVSLSALISLVRGFVREVVSVVVWAAAFWLGIRYAGVLAGNLEGVIASPTVRLGAAFTALFVAALVVGALVNNALGALVGRTGLTGTDRLLGVLFGAGRGLVVTALLILVVGFTPAPQERWWSESVLVTGIQPWICRAGAGEWFQRLGTETPLGERGPMGEMASALEYWVTYCGERGR